MAVRSRSSSPFQKGNRFARIIRIQPNRKCISLFRVAEKFATKTAGPKWKPWRSVFFGLGEAHQLANAGEEDFVYYVIADNPRGDMCHYPDSGKFAVWKENGEEVIVKATEADYFDGEE